MFVVVITFLGLLFTALTAVEQVGTLIPDITQGIDIEVLDLIAARISPM